ncbi:MAG: protein translocase subunit SecD [Lentisphaeraceae bacterium]|nr:protein translocase subunit SecD [Lentisphaeraceae bacterium]
MDNTKQSIRYRLIFCVAVLLAWAFSMFPLTNQDYFAHVKAKSKSNIESKLTDEAKIKELQEALVKAAEANRKLDTKKTREALIDARADLDEVISNDEKEAFEKALAKAEDDYKNKRKRRPTDPVPMTRSGALLNACGKNVQLYKFIDVPGLRAGNKKVTKYIERATAGKIKAGIDLKGGVEFTMQFNLEDLKGLGENGTDADAGETRDRVIEILRKRIDSKGLAEVELRPFADNAIMIRVPAVNDEEVAGIRSLLMKQAKLEFRPVVAPSAAGAERVEAPNEQGGFIFLGDVEMDGENIENAYPTQDENGNWEVSKSFNSEGAKEFAIVTRKYVGQRVAIVLDNVCYSAPNINTVIAGGQASISGGFTKEEAQELAIVLQSGSMPVELKFAGESRTDPTLGADSVRSGILSCLVGLVLVLIFMAFYYKKAGLIAVLALVANILLVIGSMAILGATFTLPGIAGIILTIGMAVDTNVLIFERIREELSTGKTLFNSTREGFGKAFITIFDANITTLITAIVLMNFGSGPIQGFAYTLAIGIVSSMFTGIFMSRIFFDMMTKDHSIKELAGFAKKPLRTIDFWAMRKKAVTFSVVLVTLSLAVIIGKGSDLMSVDFTGGNSLIYNVSNEGITQAKVKDALKTAGFQNPNVIAKSALTDTEKHLEVTVKESHEDFEDVSDNAQLFDKIDAIVREGFTADDAPRVGQLSVGGVVGAEFKSQAFLAIALSLIAIFLYITLRFESIFAIGAIAALTHDTIIALGIYALLGNQVSLPVIAALLTIIGYSLNDTIVVFDRIRENSGEIKKKTIIEIMNVSINGTVNRTILTSLTTLLVVLILTIFGGGAISGFALILLIGVVIGTYSSIFVASPIVCNSKLGTQLERIHTEKEEREEKLRTDQTVMAE